jgi:hypothetical protein
MTRRDRFDGLGRNCEELIERKPTRRSRRFCLPDANRRRDDHLYSGPHIGADVLRDHEGAVAEEAPDLNSQKAHLVELRQAHEQ